MERRRIPVMAVALLTVTGMLMATAIRADCQKAKFPKKTGVSKPGVKHDIAELVPVATFPVEGHPDWMAVTEDAVWVTSSNVNHVVRLDAKTNEPGVVVTVAKPCSGLVVDIGSLC